MNKLNNTIKKQFNEEDFISFCNGTGADGLVL